MSLFASYLLLLTLMFVYLPEGESSVTTAMAIIGKAGATVSFNGMYVFTSEIFPTEVRNIGLGSSSMTARISGIMAPYVGGSFVSYDCPCHFSFGIIYNISGNSCTTYFCTNILFCKLCVS